MTSRTCAREGCTGTVAPGCPSRRFCSRQCWGIARRVHPVVVLPPRLTEAERADAVRNAASVAMELARAAKAGDGAVIQAHSDLLSRADLWALVLMYATACDGMRLLTAVRNAAGECERSAAA